MIIILFYQISASTIPGKIERKSNENNKLKALAQRWNDKVKLPDGSYSV